MPKARPPVAARGTTATSRTRTARTTPRARPIPGRRTAPRDRASSTISTDWAIRSSDWTRSRAARIDATSKCDAEECKRDLLGCDEINPPASEMVPQVSLLAKIGLVGLTLVSALGIALSFRSLRDGTWNGLNSFMSGSTRYRGLIARGLAISIVVGAVSFLLGKALYLRVPQIGDWLTQDGQPMALLEGISVWPTVFLRGAALALCVWMIWYSWR